MSTATATPKMPASAKPGTTAEVATKPKKEKKPKVERTLLAPPEGGFTDWPKEWDPKIHKPLRRKDFANDVTFLNRKADHYEIMAKRFRQEAIDSEKLGGLKERGKAKKLLQMQRKFEELKAQLKADNVDVEAILASLGQTAAATT